MYPFVSSAHNNDRIKTNLELLLTYPIDESLDNLGSYLTLHWGFGLPNSRLDLYGSYVLTLDGILAL